MDNAVHPILTIMHEFPLSTKQIGSLLKYSTDIGSGIIDSLIQRPNTARHEDADECG